MTRSAHRVFSLYPCPSRRALSARPPGLPQCRGGRGAGGAVLGHGGQRPELGAPDRSPGDHAGGTQSQRDPGGGPRLQAALGLRRLGQPDREPEWQCRGQQHGVHRGQHAQRDRRDGLPAEPRDDPQTGRFLTQDPLGLGGGANLYAYAGNNPVSFSDPFGLRPEPPCRTEKDGMGDLPLPEGWTPTRSLGRIQRAMGVRTGTMRTTRRKSDTYRILDERITGRTGMSKIRQVRPPDAIRRRRQSRGPDRSAHPMATSRRRILGMRSLSGRLSGRTSWTRSALFSATLAVG